MQFTRCFDGSESFSNVFVVFRRFRVVLTFRCSACSGGLLGRKSAETRSRGKVIDDVINR